MSLVETRLWSPSFHVCAVCLRPVERVVVGARAPGGTHAKARCHRRWMATVIPDTAAEDRPRFFWFDGLEGELVETPRERQKRELAEDLERVRAARQPTAQDTTTTKRRKAP